MPSKQALPLILTLSLFAGAGAGVPARPAHAAGQMPSFNRVDVDKDGTVSRDEARRAGILDDKSFKAADRDGDDRLSQAEYRDAAERAGGEQPPGV